MLSWLPESPLDALSQLSANVDDLQCHVFSTLHLALAATDCVTVSNDNSDGCTGSPSLYDIWQSRK